MDIILLQNIGNTNLYIIIGLGEEIFDFFHINRFSDIALKVLSSLGSSAYSSSCVASRMVGSVRTTWSACSSVVTSLARDSSIVLKISFSMSFRVLMGLPRVFSFDSGSKSSPFMPGFLSSISIPSRKLSLY